jgi:hypothetical protein
VASPAESARTSRYGTHQGDRPLPRRDQRPERDLGRARTLQPLLARHHHDPTRGRRDRASPPQPRARPAQRSTEEVIAAERSHTAELRPRELPRDLGRDPAPSTDSKAETGPAASTTSGHQDRYLSPGRDGEAPRLRLPAGERCRRAVCARTACTVRCGDGRQTSASRKPVRPPEASRRPYTVVTDANSPPVSRGCGRLPRRPRTLAGGPRPRAPDRLDARFLFGLPGGAFRPGRAHRPARA